MNFDEIRAVVKECSLPNYSFAVTTDSRGEMFLQGVYLEKDTVTGVEEMQYTRRWFISPHMTKSEIVRTVFKCGITGYEDYAERILDFAPPAQGEKP